MMGGCGLLDFTGSEEDPVAGFFQTIMNFRRMGVVVGDLLTK
jgi:hypothetical protein